jgi:hypothetical protein
MSDTPISTSGGTLANAARTQANLSRVSSRLVSYERTEGRASSRLVDDGVMMGILAANQGHRLWKEICWRFGIARATAHRRWPWRLNGRRVTGKRGRRFVVEMVERA